MIERTKPILNKGHNFSAKPEIKSGFGQTVIAMNRERYSSIASGFSNFLEHGHVVAEKGIHPDEPKWKIWNAWEDESTRDYYFDQKYFPYRADLTSARNSDHFWDMVEHIDQKQIDLDTIANSTWGVFIPAMVVDPVNALSIAIPVARSKTVFDAIIKSAFFSGATMAPVEFARVKLDPTVKPMEGVINTGASMALAIGATGAIKGVSRTFSQRAIRQAEEETQAFFKAVYAQDEPLYRSGEGTVVSGKSLSEINLPKGTVMSDKVIPVIDKPDAIAPNAFVNSFAYKAFTTGEKRILLDYSLPDEIHSSWNTLAGTWTHLLNKNKAGVPSNMSVHLKAGPNRAKWIAVEDALQAKYREDTGVTPVGVMDYKLPFLGWKGFREWTKDINKKYVIGKTDELSKSQKEALDIMIPFWKDWGKKLEATGRIGSRKSLNISLAKRQTHLDKLKIILAERQKDSKLKSTVNYWKNAVKETEAEVLRLKQSINNLPKEVLPANEVFYFPRFWNFEKIKSNRAELESVITDWYEKNPYVWKNGEQVLMPFDRTSAAKRAKETVTNILNEKEYTFDSTYSGNSSMHLKHRALDIPNEKVYDFIEQDPIQVMQAYTSKIAPSYEFDIAFGGRSFQELMHDVRSLVEKKNGSKRADQVVRDFDAMYRRIVTNTLDDPDALSQKIRTALVDASQFSFLGSAGFSTLSDYAAILMQREMGAFWKLAFSILERDKIKLNAKEVRLAGEALDIRLGQVQQRLADEISNSPFDRGVYDRLTGKAKTAYFAANLLAPLTTIAKKLEGTLRAHQIIEDSIKWSNNRLSAKDIKINAMMGWDIKKAREIAKLAQQEGDFAGIIQKTKAGLWVPNSTEWLKAGIKQETLDGFRDHMNAGVFNAVIMASPADKPIIMDGVVHIPWSVAKFIPGMKQDKVVRGYARYENGLLATPFTFYSYTFGALNKITAKLSHNTLHNRAIGLVAGMGLAYMGLQLRYRNKPWVLENMSLSDKLARSFDYSGMGAIYSDLFYKGITAAENLGYPNSYIQPKYISRDKDERPLDAVLEPFGAPASLVVDVGRSVSKIAKGEFGEGTNDLLRTMPFWRLWFLENETKELGRVLNRF